MQAKIRTTVTKLRNEKKISHAAYNTIIQAVRLSEQALNLESDLLDKFEKEFVDDATGVDLDSYAPWKQLKERRRRRQDGE